MVAKYSYLNSSPVDRNALNFFSEFKSEENQSDLFYFDFLWNE